MANENLEESARVLQLLKEGIPNFRFNIELMSAVAEKYESTAEEMFSQFFAPTDQTNEDVLRMLLKTWLEQRELNKWLPNYNTLRKLMSAFPNREETDVKYALMICNGVEHTAGMWLAYHPEPSNDRKSADTPSVFDIDFFLAQNKGHSQRKIIQLLEDNLCSRKLVCKILRIKDPEVSFGRNNEDEMEMLGKEFDRTPNLGDPNEENSHEYKFNSHEMIDFHEFCSFIRRKERKRRFSDEALFSEWEDLLAELQDPESASKVDKFFQQYSTWILDIKAKYEQQQEENSIEYERTTKVSAELGLLKDTAIMRRAKVIGMTTSGAARLRSVLQTIRPRIVIVEEAAEIFEPHQIASLSDGCEHLIMIGDHQQLRPKPTVYKLARDYHFDISLFERLINNGLPFVCLQTQHRMRSDISQNCLTPYIYETLFDAPSVAKYPEVTGLVSPVFFVNHSKPESKGDDNLGSKENPFEAQFIIEMAHYLIQQDYKPNQIVILTFYQGQAFHIRDLRNRHQTLKPIKVSTVDDYQGEECDIVLLSMVRSNQDGKIGFLSENNRLCVALSRAKIGFYCFGNFEFIAKHSALWSKIYANLRQKTLTGESFGVKCIAHGTVQNISSPQDFGNLAPEGGCRQKCDFRLDCGHACPSFCHNYDIQHDQRKTKRCREPCRKFCAKNGHACPKQGVHACFERCPLCPVERDVVIDGCNHETVLACHLSPVIENCPVVCGRKMLCGHFCAGKCKNCTPRGTHNPCNQIMKGTLPECGHEFTYACKDRQNLADKKCTKKVSKRWPNCGHEQVIECYKDVSEKPCPNPCSHVLPKCDHRCRGTCGACFQGRIHIPCQEKCQKVLICGHECKDFCSEGGGCSPCPRPCETSCPHSKCCIGKTVSKGGNVNAASSTQVIGRTCYEPCEPCSEKCKWSCDHYQCEHFCNEPCTRPACKEPCKKKLLCSKMEGCEFACRGVCGEPCIQLCDKHDMDEWKKIQEDGALFGDPESGNCKFIRLQDCGHIFDVDFYDAYAAAHMKDAEVKSLKCVQCSVSIRNSLRYGNAVKKTRNVIEAIKRQQKTGNQLETIQLKQEEIFKSCKELIKVYRDQRIRDILSSVQQMTKQKGRKISMQQISRWECIVKLTKALSGLPDRANKISQVQSVSSTPNRARMSLLQIRNMSKLDAIAKQTNDSYLPIIAEIIETPMVEIEKSMEGFPQQLSRLFTKVAARLEEFYDLLIGTLLLEHKRASERFLIQLEAEYHREDLKCLLLFVLVTACSLKRRITDDQKSAIQEIKEAICKTDALDKGKLTAIHNKISKLETVTRTLSENVEVRFNKLAVRLTAVEN